MAYFLLHITVALPEAEDPLLAGRMSEEPVRARELQDAGTIVGLWREAGRVASFGIWKADDEATARELVATLPMSPYMTVEMTELHAHPNATKPYLLGAD